MTAPARLLTAEQLCETFGIPSPRTVRTMRQQGLAGVRLGKQYLFDPADVQAFIERKKECHAPTQARGSNGSKSASDGISSNTSVAQSGSIQRALQTAALLKRRSPPTSAQVIGLPAAPASRAG